MKIYVDGACIRQQNIGTWSVVDGNNLYRGAIKKHNLDIMYCELYAIYQALIIRINSNEKVTIYSDNSIVSNLNKNEKEFNKRLNRKGKLKIKNKDLLKKVWLLYNNSPNISIKQISRNDNKLADAVASLTLKELKK